MVIWEPVVTTKNCLWRRRAEGEGRERRKREVNESYA